MFSAPAIPALTSRPLISGTPRVEHSVTYEATFDAWYSLARAYWKAGLELLNVCRTGTPEQTQVLTPGIFLIRHSAELHIKSMILDAGAQRWTKPTKRELNVLNGHSLAALWDLLEKRLSMLGRVNEDHWWKRVRHIVGQLDELDRTSMDFRYPIDKAGGKLAAGNDITIDVQNFLDVLAELNLMLEGTSAWIDNLRGVGDY